MFKQLQIILLISVFHFSNQQSSGPHDDKLSTELDNSGHLLADSGHLLADTSHDFADTQELRRTKRDRSRSRYNPASAASNPNRGRKRIRNNPATAAVAPAPQENPLPQTQSFTSNRFPSQFQDFSFQSQATTPAPAPQRSPVKSRTTLTRVQRPDISPQQNFRNFYDDPQEAQTQPSTRSRSRARSRSRTLESSNNFNNFNRDPVTEAPRRLTNTRLTNRGNFNRNQQTQQDNRDFNPQVLRNLNKFYGDQSLKRKELFDRKKNYCDYDDYDRTEVDTSQQQEDNPTHITVTHTLPLASNINNFLLPSITSVQLIAVGDLKSTNIDNSPVIYAHTSTAPGHVLYDALRAKEELSTLFTTSCYNGRQSVFSVQKTKTIYSVETISEAVTQESSQDISDLLSKFLSLSPQPNNPIQTPSLAISSTEITHTITHSSTYVTQVTETESTELAVTFRGKPIVTTIVDTSVKEITATEYSTQTSVDTRLVTQTLPFNPLVTPNTQLISALAQQNPSLENQLLLLQLSNLLPQQQQQFSTPALPQQQFITTTSEIIHTNSYVTTLTEASSDIIPIIFRGKQIETTIVNTQTREITATEYSTEVVTRTQPAFAPLLLQQQPAQLPAADLLGGLLPDLLADLSLYPNIDYADSLENLIDDSLLDPRLIAAALQDPSLEDQLLAQEEREEARQDVAEVRAAAPEPQFSLTTIFKSGRNPGEFTRLVSTIYFDDARQRRDVIDPSGIQMLKSTDTVTNFDTIDIDTDHDEVQSGLNF